MAGSFVAPVRVKLNLIVFVRFASDEKSFSSLNDDGAGKVSTFYYFFPFCFLMEK